jgi:hypothetical protein
MPRLINRVVMSAKRLRADTRAALATHRARRRAMSRSARRTLRQRRSATVASLRAALQPAAPSLWELWPGGGDRAARDERLRGDVLKVIEQHPDGVAAVDVGNRLGVDWRRVLGIGRALAEGGLVDQVDREFFPVGKASRRW